MVEEKNLKCTKVLKYFVTGSRSVPEYYWLLEQRLNSKSLLGIAMKELLDAWKPFYILIH